MVCFVFDWYFDRSVLSCDAWLMFRDNANPESHEVLIWIIVWPLGSQTVFVWGYHFPSLSFCCCILFCSLSLLGFCPHFPHPVCTVSEDYAWRSRKQWWSTHATSWDPEGFVGQLMNSNEIPASNFKRHCDVTQKHTEVTARIQPNSCNIPYFLSFSG